MDRIRPDGVAAGQADGIQPRTIEVLQVRVFNPITSAVLIAFSELWSGRTSPPGECADAHGGRYFVALIELASLRISKAFYNPSADGGIERTARVSNIDAPTARYPFAVSLSLDTPE